MKKRIITLVLSALAVVLLVGVGFASWVISQGATSEQKGNILVETVKDERLAVSISDPSGAFQFGAPNGATKDGNWLFEDNDAALPENLEVSFIVTVTRPTAFALNAQNQPDGLSLTAVLGDKVLASATDTTGVDYPVAFFAPAATPTRYGVNAANDDTLWTMSNGNMTATTTVVVELKWGDLFGNVNPYEFFNEKSGTNFVRPVNGKLSADEVSALNAAGLKVGAEDFTVEDTYGDYALAALEKIREFNSYLFKLTIEVNVA